MARSTVLVVEDEELLRANLALIVRGCGFDVLTAADGEEATAALSTTSVDIVLTDIVMPRLDGYGLIRWMLAHDMAQPVVVLSGYNSLESAVEALRLGAYDYISKPFELADVEAALHRAEVNVANRRADAALRQRNRELAALNSISAAVSSSLELNEMLDRALGTTVEVLGLIGAIIYLGSDTGELDLYRSYGPVHQLHKRMPLAIARPDIRGVVLGVSHVVQVLGRTSTGEWYDELSPRAALPLLANGQLCGLLLLVGTALHPIQHDQLTLLESIGNYIGVAITNVQLYARVRDAASHFEREVAQRTDELRQSRDLLRTVFDGIPGGLLLMDSSERILATNRAYDRLLGCEPDALQKLTYRQVWATLGAHEVGALAARSLARRQPIFLRDRLFRDGASPMVLDHYLFPVSDANEQVVQVIEYLEDVTERLALERVASQTEQLAALGKLAATVAHEVNTPLLAIRGCLSLVASHQHDPVAHAEYLSLAENELDRAAGIISGMLEFYRPAGNERTATDINNLIVRVAQLLKAECSQRNVAVDLQLATDLPPVFATPDQLKQVLLNLILNALEAQPDGGQIVLRTRYSTSAARPTNGGSADQIYIDVEDHGPGVPLHLRDQIFDAFVTTKADGNGLGLAVSRMIIRDHSGTITVANGSNGGARFRVALPVTTELTGSATLDREVVR